MEWAGFDEDTPIQHSMVSKAIKSAQERVEGHHFEIRKHLVDYDDVISKHREVIYGERKKILTGSDLKANIRSMVQEELQSLVVAYLGDEQSDIEGLWEDVNRIMPMPPELSRHALSQMRRDEIETKLIDYAESLYEKREGELGEEAMRLLERLVMLRALDNLWIEHLTTMEHTRQGIGLQSVGQRDPLVVYKKEGHALFESLMANIQHDVVNTIYHANLVKKENATPITAASKGEAVPAGRKTGRNDPCPCGSGKKYKHCCGK
jgi:preprotein translocase subunit SecA